MKGMMSFLSGVFWGGLVGATLGLLFAPSSGEELRDQMQNRAQMIQQEVKDAAEQRRIEMEQQLAQLRAPRKPGEGQSYQ